jgi:hypothetical protein
MESVSFKDVSGSARGDSREHEVDAIEVQSGGGVGEVELRSCRGPAASPGPLVVDAIHLVRISHTGTGSNRVVLSTIFGCPPRFHRLIKIKLKPPVINIKGSDTVPIMVAYVVPYATGTVGGNTLLYLEDGGSDSLG